jgi:hypothetical protein
VPVSAPQVLIVPISDFPSVEVAPRRGGEGWSDSGLWSMTQSAESGSSANLLWLWASAPDEDARLKLAVEAAVSIVGRCDHAGITINEKRGLVTRASSDEVVHRANQLQEGAGRRHLRLQGDTVGGARNT